MKVYNRKRSPIIRGFGIAIAFLLVVVCFPFNGLLALAENLEAAEIYLGDYYQYITIDGYEDSTTDTVTKGSTYNIRNAYIGAKRYISDSITDTNYLYWQIGDPLSTATYLDQSAGSVAYVSSTMKVTYNGAVVLSCTDYADTLVDDDEYVSSFTAEKEGTYTVTYSYSYEIDGKTYTNSYDLSVESVLSTASISIPSNAEYVLPSIIDLALARTGAADATTDIYKDVYIPNVEVTDEDGEEVEVEYVANSLGSNTTGKYVVVSANGGNKTADVEILQDSETGDLYIDGDIFADGNYGAGTYTIKFSYYEDGNFITSTTKTITVYSEENPYYTANTYKIVLELSSDWTDNGQTGVETTLPTATGVTSSESTPASESVDVVYSVEVKFKGVDDKSYSALSTTTYEALETDLSGNYSNKDTAVIYVENGKTYLCDPTSFKPLEDGSYTFIYTITDFYGNSVSSDEGAYEYLNIEDETAPTPIIYDASEYNTTDGYVDASYKFATQAEANGVIVYAIGMEDNVSSVGDTGVTLTRKVMTDETVTKFTIDGYDAYNLVFNYYGTLNDGDSTSTAWENLMSNNFLLRKQVGAYETANTTTVDSDATMLEFLKANNYLIVIDKGNISTIYSYFKSIFTTESISDADELQTWLEENEESTIAGLGFAYVDSDTTFGASSSQTNGMGTGYYYVYYVAEDTAGNSTSIYKRIYVVSGFTDDESPEITFSTTLATSYVTDSTITFTAPTASDSIDSNMLVKTLYRYLNENGEVIEVKDSDEEVISTENLDEVWADMEAENGTIELYNTYLSKYAAYHNSTSNSDGYIDLTDADASSYTIDLSEATNASKVQIIVYVYDDAGNIGMYGTTVDISNANDKYSPILLEGYAEDTTTYSQGETISIPDLTVGDEAVAYITFNIAVNYVSSDGTTTSLTPTGYYGERDIQSTDGTGTYKIYGGSFVASYAGDYNVSTAVKDGGGHMVIAFANYEVEGRSIVQEPSISTTLDKTQTLELDDYGVNDTIDIPVPTVTYDIPNSVTYDVYTANVKSNENYYGTSTGNGTQQDTTTTKVIYGVDEDGKPLNYTTTFGQAGYLKPRDLAVGEYDIVYTVNLYVYNFKDFKYNQSSYDGTTWTSGGYFTYVGSTYSTELSGVTIVALKDNEYTLTISNTVYTLKYVVDDTTGDGEWKIFDTNGDNVTYGTGNTLPSITSDIIEGITDGITLYSLSSDTYTITIQDTTAPVISSYDYPTALAKDDATSFTVQGIQTASDASGINLSKSSVKVSWKLASGASSYETKTGDEAGEDWNFDLKTSSGTVIDGTYTITYTVYDNAGNYSTSTYTIAVGDNEAPTITVEDDFIEETYEIGTTLVLDLNKISFDDASGVDETTATYTLTDSDGEEIEATDASDDETLYYELDQVGTYTFTITVDDNVGWTGTKDFDFEVTSKDSDSTMVYQIVGTVLIVVSVVVLAGVIIYFIVSKVKLDKELKK